MRKHTLLVLVVALAAIYLFGKVYVQAHLEFPSFIRWHLADFGFVGWWATLYAIIHSIFATRATVRLTSKRLLRWAIYGWVAAMFDELLLGELRGAHFDPIDAACYTASLALIVLAYLLNPRQEWKISS